MTSLYMQKVYAIKMNEARCCINFYISSVLIYRLQIFGEKYLSYIETNPVAGNESLLGKELVSDVSVAFNFQGPGIWYSSLLTAGVWSLTSTLIIFTLNKVKTTLTLMTPNMGGGS